MVDEKKAFTFIVIPENTSKTYTFRLRRGLLYLMGAICLLFFGAFVYVLGVYQRVSPEAQRAERLEMENAILRAQTQRTADLERELARLQNIRQRLYEMAGLPLELNQSRGGVSPAESSALLAAEEMYQPRYEVSTASPEDPTLADTILARASNAPTLWPVRGWVTAGFNEILPGREKRHRGIDIAAPQGTAILAAASGKVVFAGWDTHLGLVVILDHQNGLSTLYGHCSQVLADVGDSVVQGQIVAHLGNTGQSSAPHLHFEIREHGVAVDPRAYLGP